MPSLWQLLTYAWVCPHSYKKMQNKVYTAEEEADEAEGFFTTGYKAELGSLMTDREAHDVILYTGNKERRIASLGSETLGCALLDSGCTSNVCGEMWWRSYFDGLGEQDKMKVKIMSSDNKKFRFGG